MSYATGAYGIRRIEFMPGVSTCLECYRSWADDITPSGRCPWEHLHSTDRPQDVATRRHKAIVGGLWG